MNAATPRPQKARATAKQADDDVRPAGQPGSSDGRVEGDLGGQAQAYACPTRRGTKPGRPIESLSSGIVRASINRAALLRAAPLPSPVEPDVIPPLYVGRNIVPTRPLPESPARAGSRGRRSERHSIGRRQRRFGPERNRWTRRQGRHRSRLRDTRASMEGARLPKKDGRRTEWNRP